MQPIPQKVKNVSVYPYLDWPPGAGVGPVVEPVIVKGEGTYSVGTLITYAFYNLDLIKGEHKGQLKVGAKYTASVTTVEGNHTFTTPAMECLTAGETPTFGLTVNLLPSLTGGGDTHIHVHIEPVQAGACAGYTPGTPQELDYIVLGDVEDVNVVQPFPPPAIGQVELIRGAKGQLIGTRTGTPHLMGFKVEGGTRVHPIYKGMKPITVSAKLSKDGRPISYSDLTCEDAGDPAIFMQNFPYVQDTKPLHIHIHR